MTDAVKVRLYVPDDLRIGGSILPAEDQAHYLRHVLRLEPGAAVALFNGRDGEVRAGIAEITKKTCRLTVEAVLRPQGPASDVWLCFAPIKQGRIELIVEKATELGVGRLQPVITRRVQMQ
jgi:16S rRNA (uracil1498-N3)-methyltransferase